ncbi:hypothetical protein B5E58_02450 [Tyzzerella sp. An114]|uniref:D-alanyl-D-alanine carboxypeptidase family protein n=1 Tax=Tyzzerella sp. An114 TaxID=1965545 RepID=UPI000B451A6E|nr:D-alanyl-D-alanine carboxypeptidase family protein [Tyzzerella sp. An114]OUQ59969.1 hypothetical protein B5E58_02450 [Tyzzerella sp. An114]
MRAAFLKLFILLYIFSANISTVYAEKNEVQTQQETQTTIEPKTNLIDPNTTLDIIGESAILMDASTGEILYEKNMHEQLYPASITKLMTVLLAFEYGKLDETVTFSEEAIFGIERNSSHIALDVGEQITLEQCLYAILLQSANEASLGVAEHIGGSKEGFADMMNEKAKELGCQNTHFVNPNGLHDDNHYTSAYDMALIAKEVLKYDKFREIIATLKYEIPPTNKQPETRYLYAQHQMIKPPSIYVYEGCEGGKTGFTNQALNTLVTYTKRDDTELIAVVLKDTGANTYVDTKTLFDYGFENYETLKAFSSDDFSTQKDITQTYKKDTFDLGKLDIKADTDVYTTVKKSDTKPEYTQKINIDNNKIVPTIKEGSTIGTVDIYDGETKVGYSNLIASNTIEAIPEETIKAQKKEELKSLILNIVKIIVTVIIIFIVLIIIIRIVHRRKYRRKKFRRRKYR